MSHHQLFTCTCYTQDVFNATKDPAGRAHKAFEGMCKDPFARADVRDMRRYFEGWRANMSNLQKSLYSRFYVIP